MIEAAHALPYNGFSVRLVHGLLDHAPDGPVRTRYGFAIEFKRTARPQATAIRKAIVSGVYEHECLEIIGRLLHSGDTAVDVGAHEGYLTLWMTTLVGRTGSVYAVEPNPENLRFIERNIELNAVANVTVIPKAVGDRPCVLPFRAEPDGGAWGGLAPSASPESKPLIEVEVDTPDRLFGGLEHLELLKVDTEGTELNVFLGGEEVLLRLKPVICFEVNLTCWAHSDRSIDTLLSCCGSTTIDCTS